MVSDKKKCFYENEILELQNLILELARDLTELEHKVKKLESRNGWNWFNIQQLKDKK